MGLEVIAHMAQEAAKEAEMVEAGDAAQSGAAKPRDRSTIQFPYFSMDEAVAIAKGIHTVGGNACQVDQLAAHLNLKPDTGSFKLKLAAARLFGFITNSISGSISLTPLGSRVCDPQQEQAAKAEAFLLIPLYQRVYEQFKGASLPPLAGLEAAMVSMGVAPKQKDTARQVFQRSAQFAGFFWSGAGRLVYPPIKGSAGAVTVLDPTQPSQEGEKEPDRKKKTGDGGDGSGGEYHPFIAGLLKTLPPADSNWPMDDRRKWLLAASTIFELIYKDNDSKGSLRIEIQKESGR